MTRAGHLARRFFGSWRVAPLDDAERELVHGSLNPGELKCWERLGPADRQESVATARAARHELGPDPDARWVAAALVHDVGKAETDLGPVGRSVATVVAAIAGPRRVRTWNGRIGRYLNHDELGAARLRAAGARPEAAAWAAAHHRRALWPGTGIPPEICEILARADGEPDPR
jgi:putative nucleotidyltransferase with HDIG domain